MAMSNVAERQLILQQGDIHTESLNITLNLRDKKKNFKREA